MTNLFRSLALTLFFLVLSVNLQAVDDPLYPFHPSVNLSFESSNLPVIIINLNEVMASKEEDRRIYADMKIVWEKDGERNYVQDIEHFDYDGPIEIKYRGNSSYHQSDKKPFAVRTKDSNGKNKKVSILGMPEDSDWALLAPFSDRSMIRDILVFELMKDKFDYVPTGRYCELVLNGVYQGVYIVAARVRQGANRINIKGPTADEGDGLTGGYHLEIDRNDSFGFRGDLKAKDLKGQDLNDTPYFQIKYPDEEDLSEAQINYIQSHVWNMEKAIEGDNFDDNNLGHRAYFDTKSLTNFYITQELVRNIDAYRLSTPFYKYPDSVDPRFKFSIWDFNSASGYAGYDDGWSTEGWAFNNNRFNTGTSIPWMFKRILQDEVFYSDLKETWTSFRQTSLSDNSIHFVIDSLTTLLNESQERNFSIWDSFNKEFGANYYISSSYEDEINYLKLWLDKRVRWMDTQWFTGHFDVNLVPNGGFEAATNRGAKTNTSMSEWHKTGTIGMTSSIKHSGDYAGVMRGNSKIYQVIPDLHPGLYTFRVWVNTSLDPVAQLYLKSFDKSDATAEIRQVIQNNNNYYLIEIPNIDVTNDFIEIGFITESSEATPYLCLDDIEFVEQKNTVGVDKFLQNSSKWSVFTDRKTMSLHIKIDGDIEIGNTLEIYDAMGYKVYSKQLNSHDTFISETFERGKLYIVRMNNIVHKVLF